MSEKIEILKKDSEKMMKKNRWVFRKTSQRRKGQND